MDISEASTGFTNYSSPRATDLIFKAMKWKLLVLFYLWTSDIVLTALSGWGHLILAAVLKIMPSFYVMHMDAKTW